VRAWSWWQKLIESGGPRRCGNNGLSSDIFNGIDKLRWKVAVETSSAAPRSREGVKRVRKIDRKPGEGGPH
jgi:hypothetical protein